MSTEIKCRLVLFLFFSYLFIGCNSDDIAEDEIIPEVGFESGILDYDGYVYNKNINNFVTDPKGKSLLSIDDNLGFKRIRIDYKCNKKSKLDEKLDPFVFERSGITYDLISSSQSKDGAPVIFEGGTTISYPNSSYIYTWIIDWITKSNKLFDYLGKSSTDYSLNKHSGDYAFFFPLDIYYDENKQSTLYVTWEKKDGTITKDTITCKWFLGESIKYPSSITPYSEEGKAVYDEIKQFLHPAQIYVNNELKWDMKDWEIMDSDRGFDILVKSILGVNPVIELIK